MNHTDERVREVLAEDIADYCVDTWMTPSLAAAVAASAYQALLDAGYVVMSHNHPPRCCCCIPPGDMPIEDTDPTYLCPGCPDHGDFAAECGGD